MTHAHVPAHLHAADGAAGSVVVLNVRSGRWHVLNAAAAALWQEVGRTEDVGRAVRVVAERYPPSAHETFHADARLVIDDLSERGLIAFGRSRGRVRGPVAARPGPPAEVGAKGATNGRHVPAVARIAAPLAICLLRLPFRVAVRVVGAANSRWCVRDSTIAQAVEATTAVETALRGYPGRAACLEHSLAAVLVSLLLRRRLRWVLGVAKDPYRFHAWTETGDVAMATSDPTPLTEFTRVIAV
ncbi:lasso peptide biosynthesis B2 protein [Actinokineospora sp. 24-640]